MNFSSYTRISLVRLVGVDFHGTIKSDVGIHRGGDAIFFYPTVLASVSICVCEHSDCVAGCI